MPIPLKWVAGQIVSGADWNNARLYKGHSYIVWSGSGTYYAFAQYDGGTDYSGSSAREVIQNAIDGLANSGSIQIMRGCYVLTGSLNPAPSIEISGEGWGTVLKLGNLANSNVIKFDRNAPNVVLKDFAIDGNKANQTTPAWRDYLSGIYNGDYSTTPLRTSHTAGYNMDFLKIKNLYIHDILCGAAMRITAATSVLIEDCRVENCGNDVATTGCDAIWMGTNSGSKIINLYTSNLTDTAIALCDSRYCEIINPYIITGASGISIGNEFGAHYSDHNSLLGGTIQDIWRSPALYLFRNAANTTGSGDHTIIKGVHIRNTDQSNPLKNAYNVYVDGAQFFLIEGCQFANYAYTGSRKHIIITGSDTYTTSYGSITNCNFIDANVGIEIQGAPDYVLITSNRFGGNVTTPILYTSTPVSKIVRNNSGYITENWGWAQADSGGHATVTHGLSSHPTCILLTISGSTVATNAARVDTITSTTFQITAPAGASGNYYWYAAV